MNTDSRWSAHPRIIVGCPVCGRPLPAILVDVDARMGCRVVLALSARAVQLDAAWWRAARAEHPDCLDDDADAAEDAR